MSGYSKTPLAKKLGIKAGDKVLFINQPDTYFSLFEELPDITEVDFSTSEVDFIHFFTTSHKELKAQLPFLKERLSKTGMLWVSWPKKSAKVACDIDGNIVRHLGLEAGLVDVKVCAVDETWSGLKFMFRIKDR
ncbi:DUF3052 family protein [Fulvivirga sp. RKSG066]|uniref:DUF3052 family protein n=1 Tax=Fulvivirga aurantia TaxID=2529383 RepID=UPI0012BD263B|nr:DUF3052 family protein [Fulvivirga aurantia]MTI21872.1 DUF3052 family protein [Fulvivirga aurantia]